MKGNKTPNNLRNLELDLNNSNLGGDTMKQLSNIEEFFCVGFNKRSNEVTSSNLI